MEQTSKSCDWIKENMFGVYSESLGRQLTEAEIRVQRAIERLQIPDWYRKYSRTPPKILQNNTPIESRPALWRSFKSKLRRYKSSKKSPKNSPTPPPFLETDIGVPPPASPSTSFLTDGRSSRQSTLDQSYGVDSSDSSSIYASSTSLSEEQDDTSRTFIVSADIHPLSDQPSEDDTFDHSCSLEWQPFDTDSSKNEPAARFVNGAKLKQPGYSYANTDTYVKSSSKQSSSYTYSSDASDDSVPAEALLPRSVKSKVNNATRASDQSSNSSTCQTDKSDLTTGKALQSPRVDEAKADVDEPSRKESNSIVRRVSARLAKARALRKKANANESNCSSSFVSVKEDKNESNPRDTSWANDSKASDANSSRSTLRSLFNISKTFPRMTPSRKIQHLNIVFPPPETPPEIKSILENEDAAHQTAVDTLLTKDNSQLGEDSTLQLAPSSEADSSCDESNNEDKTRSTFYYDVKPKFVSNLASLPVESEKPASRPSPVTRFFNSAKKSTTLERMIKSRRRVNQWLVQDKISQLKRRALRAQTSPDSGTYSRDLTLPLDESLLSSDKRQDSECEFVTDSELARSVSLSLQESGSEFSPASSPPPSENCCFSDDEQGWIAPKTSAKDAMPRSSTRLSHSEQGCFFDNFGSPRVSPITGNPNGWGLTYSVRKSKKRSRMLPKIEEAVGDSGYSDRSAESKAPVQKSKGTSLESVVSSSEGEEMSSSTASIIKYKNESVLNCSGPYVFSSFVV